jgi:glucan phosphoethanolaminetransferase (alkaline phosphatase superfamily)
MNFIIFRWKNLNTGLRWLIFLGTTGAIFLLVLAISKLIETLDSPKPVYLFIFWFQIIFFPTTGMLYIMKRKYYKNALKAKIFLIAAFSGIYIFLWGPMVMDIPNLLIGQYESVEGQPEKIWMRNKSLTDQVYIGGKEVAFFINSNMRGKEKKQKYYHIEYLPHSKYAINVKEIRD